MLFAHGQSFQVAWINPLNWHSVLDVVQHQYFDNSVPFAILAALIFVAALTIRLTGRWRSAGDTRRVLIICAAWIVVPTAVSLIYSAISDPFYYPRYLFFTTPAMAVVLAVCIVAVARTAAMDRRWCWSCSPQRLSRIIFCRNGSGTPKKAGITATSPTSLAPMRHPGTAYWSTTRCGWLPGPIRALLAARPAAYRPLVDVGRGVPAPERGTLWDGHLAVWLVTGRLYKCTTVWTISTHDTTLPAHQSGTSLPPRTGARTRTRVPNARAGRVSHRRTVAIPPNPGRQVDPLNRRDPVADLACRPVARWHARRAVGQRIPGWRGERPMRPPSPPRRTPRTAPGRP